MLWMETYLFYYTVRLGVIIIGIFSFFQLLVPAILLLIYGMSIIEPILNLFQNDADYKYNSAVQRIIDWMEKEPQTAMAILLSYLFTHMATCLLLVFGALKLNKWCLVPFAALELLRVVYILAGHIVLMIMLKKLLNLGVLITYTLAGGFLILYLGYNWATSVGLFQIISLINSERYKRLYGEDPFRPIIRQTVTSSALPQLPYGTVQNVRVLTTPNSGTDIDELKRQNSLRPQHVGIIAVLPVNGHDDYSRQPLILGLRKLQKPQTPPQQAHTVPPPDAYTNDYNNWQWSELPGAYQQRQLNMRNHFISRY